MGENTKAKRECPVCGNMYLLAKKCIGDATVCHIETETILIKEKGLELEK